MEFQNILSIVYMESELTFIPKNRKLCQSRSTQSAGNNSNNGAAWVQDVSVGSIRHQLVHSTISKSIILG